MNAPNRPLPRAATVVAGLLALGALVAAFRDPLFAWQPALAAIVLTLRPRAAVWVLAVMTTILLAVGGAVTTYRVGMAVPDWPATMGRNMFAYPLDEMLASGWGVTLEHSHRLWASAVGLVTLMLFVVCLVRRERPGLARLSGVALVCVIGQGILGGTRVLENSQNLAFLHGAFAQVFYALVAALFVVTSRSWQRELEHSSFTPKLSASGRLVPLALATLCAVYGQIVLGAWLRHSGLHVALGLHLGSAVVVFALVTILARRIGRLAEAAASSELEAPPLGTLRAFLLRALHGQVALGALATVAIFGISEGFAGRVSLLEAVSATLHVALGAVLLGSVVAASMWSARITRSVRAAGPSLDTRAGLALGGEVA